MHTHALNEWIAELRESIEGSSSDRVSDLHICKIGHGINAAEITIVSHVPKEPTYYKSLISPNLGIVHATVEVHRCDDH